jgi:aminomethyltransferase
VHRQFTGFVFNGAASAAGTKLQKDGREIGEITSIATLPGPSGRISVALGYARREAGGAGAKLEVSGVEATLTGLPFNL